MTEIEAVRECEAIRHDDPRDMRISVLEAKLAKVRQHYEQARRPYDAEHRIGYEDGPKKDAVVSALSLLIVDIESE